MMNRKEIKAICKALKTSDARQQLLNIYKNCIWKENISDLDIKEFYRIYYNIVNEYGRDDLTDSYKNSFELLLSEYLGDKK